jgi:hypothetical protein
VGTRILFALIIAVEVVFVIAVFALYANVLSMMAK